MKMQIIVRSFRVLFFYIFILFLFIIIFCGFKRTLNFSSLYFDMK